MIEQLRIQNYKNWQDTGEIELKPITIFFGSNSSGKSSIGQFLMLLKQSVESSDRKTVFFPGNEFSAVDVGMPSEMITDGNIDNPIQFHYRWGMQKTTFNDAYNKINYTADAIDFSAKVKVLNTQSQALEVSAFLYQLFQTDNDIAQINVGMDRSENKNNGKQGYEMTFSGYNFKKSTGRPWPISAPVRFYGFPDEAVAYYQNADILQRLNLLHEKLFSTVYYLGPLRSKAKRIYSWSGNIPQSVGFQGEDTIMAILAAQSEGRKINLGPNRPRLDFSLVIAKMLKKMNLIEDIEIKPISDNRQDYDVKVKTRGAKNGVDIPDVGFGVSQVLPVLVEMFYAPKGSTIIMEQPELHLHPSAQAGLADVMIDAIKAREGDPRDVQLIIESHSEHFLRRLQRRVAENVINVDDIQAYFVNTTTSPPKLEALSIDLFGDISNWPDGFFGDIASDIFYKTDAALTRRMAETDK